MLLDLWSVFHVGVEAVLVGPAAAVFPSRLLFVSGALLREDVPSVCGYLEIYFWTTLQAELNVLHVPY